MNRNQFLLVACSILFFSGCTTINVNPAAPDVPKIECTKDADCPSGRQCLMSICVAPRAACAKNEDCPGFGAFSCLGVSCAAGQCSYMSQCACAKSEDCPGFGKDRCVAITCQNAACVPKSICECKSATDCNDSDACTLDLCVPNDDPNGPPQVCVHQRDQNLPGCMMPVDGGGTGSDMAMAPSADLASPPPDLGAPADLAQPTDTNQLPDTAMLPDLVAPSPDLAARDLTTGSDQAVTPDLVMVSDQATLPDVGTAPDQTAAPDLARAADMAQMVTTCKWTYLTDAGTFTSISMSMKVNSKPMEELCQHNIPGSTSIMCSKTGLKHGDQMDISVEYVLNGEPSWSCFGHGAQGEQRGVLSCVFSHTQAFVINWQKVSNGGMGAAEGCNLRGFVP